MNSTSIIEKMDSHRLEDYGTLSKVIQFGECIGFLDKIGKVIYGNQFKIRPADYKVIFQLLVYFYCDLENATHLGINLKKGILLSGRVGCGKTSLMFLMRHFLAKDAQYTVVATRDIYLKFFTGYNFPQLYLEDVFFGSKTSCPTPCWEGFSLATRHKKSKIF